MMIRNLLVILLLAGLLVGLRWVLHTQQPDEVLDTITINPRLDYHLVNLEARWYDAQGRATGSLTAAEINQSAATGIGEVHTPVVRWNEADTGAYTIMVAEQGQIDASRDLITMRGGVDAQQFLPDGGGARVRTGEMSWRRSSGDIQAEGPVDLEQPGARLQGTGLTGNLLAKRYQLLSEVQGRYEVP